MAGGVVTTEEIDATITRLETLAEFHIGTPVGGVAIAALRTIFYLRKDTA
jgi:hypothetical protein